MVLLHYLHVLRRNAVLLLAFVALGIALGAFPPGRQPPLYEAKADVLLRPENQGLDPSLVGATARFDPVRFATVESAVITSPAMAVQVAPQIPGATVEQVLESVSVSRDETSTILTIAATDRDPGRAALIANAMADAYVEWRRTQEASTVERAIAELDQRLAALSERLPALEQEAATAAAAAAAAGTVVTQSADLLAARDQYAAIFARQQDLLVQLSLQRPTAEVLKEASVPQAPVGLGPVAQGLIGALLGGVIGLAIAFAREELDDRVRSREEVQAVVDVPVLAELPVDRRSARSDVHIAMADDSRGHLAEAIRSLRTSISFMAVDRDEGIRRLVVTSTVAGDGKTLVAANLAAAYAQVGRRTVLVSADLRRPRVDAMFRLGPGGAGLADVFATAAPKWAAAEGGAAAILDDVTLPTDVPNLWLLPAGGPVPNPAELLSSGRMDEVVAHLSRRFDMVIFDASPLLAVTDAAALAPKVGHVLIVAGVRSTRRRALARAVEMVATTRTEVVGVVLNRVSGQTATYRGTAAYGQSATAPAEALDDDDRPTVKVR